MLVNIITGLSLTCNRDIQNNGDLNRVEVHFSLKVINFSLKSKTSRVAGALPCLALVSVPRLAAGPLCLSKPVITLQSGSQGGKGSGAEGKHFLEVSCAFKQPTSVAY